MQHQRELRAQVVDQLRRMAAREEARRIRRHRPGWQQRHAGCDLDRAPRRARRRRRRHSSGRESSPKPSRCESVRVRMSPSTITTLSPPRAAANARPSTVDDLPSRGLKLVSVSTCKGWSCEMKARFARRTSKASPSTGSSVEKRLRTGTDASVGASSSSSASAALCKPRSSRIRNHESAEPRKEAEQEGGNQVEHRPRADRRGRSRWRAPSPHAAALLDPVRDHAESCVCSVRRAPRNESSCSAPRGLLTGLQSGRRCPRELLSAASSPACRRTSARPACT